MKKNLLKAGIFLASVAPLAAFAQQGSITNTQTSLVNTIKSLTTIVNYLIPFFIAIATVVFIYGVIKYVVATAPDAKDTARGYIIWGIVGIAVILSLFGLVKLLQNTFGINSTDLNAGDIPQINI